MPSAAELEGELETELRYLRTVLREVTGNYATAREADIERVIEAVGDEDVPGREDARARRGELMDMLDRLRALKVKPQKGRLRDIARIDKLVAELAEQAENLSWGEVQEDRRRPGSNGAPVTVQDAGFGCVVVNGKRYERDVVIHPGGRVAKRKKQLSKKRYGTGHRVSAEELEAVVGDRTPSLLIVGTGHAGALSLAEDAIAWLGKRDISYRAQPTPGAIEAFRQAEGEKMAFLHVTC